LVEEWGVDRSKQRDTPRDEPGRPGAKRPYERPRVLTDEAFEQISLACSMKFGAKKNFT
jgi:hypothetical protein